tara:strand:+ start:690 stop:872 length:183 start_codon:yes stop_codon:yes gene_type:complete
MSNYMRMICTMKVLVWIVKPLLLGYLKMRSEEKEFVAEWVFWVVVVLLATPPLLLITGVL